jgi:hypothetical protein
MYAVTMTWVRRAAIGLWQSVPIAELQFAQTVEYGVADNPSVNHVVTTTSRIHAYGSLYNEWQVFSRKTG